MKYESVSTQSYNQYMQPDAIEGKHELPIISLLFKFEQCISFI